MADKLTSIKIKHKNGSYSDQIPISVLVQNVQWDQNHNLLDALGSVDLSSSGKGNLQHQIDELDEDKISHDDFNSQLDEFLSQQIREDTESWLEENVNTGQTIGLTTNLTVSGLAADAKAVGDAIDAKTFPIDSTLSDSSTNPVQNKVVTSAISELNEVVTSAISELNDSLSNLEDVVNGTDLSNAWVTGKYIATNGSTVNVNTPTTYDQYMYLILPVQSGETYVITVIGGILPRAWCITDASYNVLSAAGESAIVDGYPLTIPTNGAYLILNHLVKSYSGKDPSVEKVENSIGQRVNGLESHSFRPEDYVYGSGVGVDYLATPIMYLDGDVSMMTKETKVNLAVRFKGIEMGCTCKWQGATSIAYPKKNYTVTFDYPVVVRSEWGAKKKYVLKSEFFDNTHTRNTVSAKLWAEIVADREKRNCATTLDDEEGTPITLENGTTTIDINDSRVMGSPGNGCNDGFHIMLVINGKYNGLYTMGIPKDDWMFDMDNKSPNCAVLNAEVNGNVTKFAATTTASQIENEQTFSLEYSSKDMNIDRIATSINTMLSAVIGANNANYKTAIDPYLDMDSAIDYFIYSLLIGNWDGVSHNYNLATYDGVRWMFSAYDLDNTFGFEDLVGWKYETIYDDPVSIKPNLPISAGDSRLFWLIYTYGKAEFKARYTQLRSGILSEHNIFTKFYNHISPVSKRVLAEEFVIWPTTQRSGAQTIDAIVNWYRLRCEYLDAKVNAL